MSTQWTVGRRGILFATLAAIALIGCVPSEHPISGEDDSKIDEKLIGSWKLERERDSVVVRKNEKLRNALEIVDASSSDPIFTTEIDGKKYLSYRQFERGKVYYLARYELSPDEKTLTVTFANEDKILEAIKQERLAGSVTIEKATGLLGFLLGETRHVRLTETSANLRAFFAKHGESCFSEPESDRVLTLRRAEAK